MRFPPRFSFLFFFPPFLLFSLPQAFTIEKATRRRAKRRWTIENRNFVFARKNKTPLLVCRSGDHRCFSKRSKNLRASGENSRFSLDILCYDDIYRWRGEKEREKERGEVLASKGKFPSLKLLVSLSLFLWTDRKHFKKRFEKGREEEEEEELEEGGKKRSSDVVPVYFFAGVMECKVAD